MDLFKPQDIFISLEDGLEKYVAALRIWRGLERYEKPLLANLALGFEGSVASREMEARASSAYHTHVKGMVEAEANFIQAQGHWKNLNTLAELRRTEETTRRSMTK
jgi:hypothetical protein